MRSRSSQKRILFVGNLVVGGAELYLDRLIRSLDAQQYACVVALLRPYGLPYPPPPETELIELVRERSTARTAWKHWLLIPRLVRLMRERQIDLVHTQHLGINSMYAQVAARMLRIPTVETLQHALAARSRTDEVLMNHPVGRWVRDSLVDRFISLGEVMRQEQISQWRIPEHQLFLNRMGVNTEHFAPQSDQLRQEVLKEWGIEPSRTVLGFIGRPDPVKGFHKVLRLIHYLIARHPKIVLLAVGVSRDQADYEEQVVNLGIEDHVVFVGRRNDIHRVIAGMDWYIQASDGPVLGNTTLECMSSGKPIGTIVQSEHERWLATETCREGLNGSIIDLEKLPDEARRFGELCVNGSVSRKMGRVSREIAMRDFSQQEHGKRMAMLYDELIERSALGKAKAHNQ